jgi:hypothetical protein
MGPTTKRPPDVTAQTTVAASASLQVSVGIKNTSDVTMNIQEYKNMMNKTVSKIKVILIAVLYISCLSSASLTRSQENNIK